MIRAGHHRDSLAAALPDRLAASLDSIFPVEATFRPHTEQRVIRVTTPTASSSRAAPRSRSTASTSSAASLTVATCRSSSPTTTIRPSFSTEARLHRDTPDRQHVNLTRT